jgi:predicted Zn finger-like uncharacterized protein
MSLITQCPACNTLFKVVSDQLKISQGWVRCGQCKEVFDANAHWFQPAPDLHTEVLKNQPVEGAVLLDDKLTARSVETPRVQIFNAPLAEIANGADPALLVHQRNPDLSDALLGETISIDKLSDVQDDPLLAPEQPALQKIVEVLEDEVPIASTEQQTPSAATPSFVRQAQRAQKWRSPWVRFGLGLLVLVLLVAVALQVAVHERDRIAALQPKAQPWLTEMCRFLGCSVGPLKHIDSVVVDSSSFNKIRNEGKNELYKVALNLKNTGALAVALPHIELSLNDSQDQTIVRRVLSPADLGAVQFVLTPRAEFSANAVVQVDTTQLAGLRIAGYRIWAFYP